MSDKKVSVVRPHGWIEIVGPDGTLHFDTQACAHCRHHFMIVKGSGATRGWCHHCNGPLCSRKCAAKCVPFEQWLENVEAGRDPGYVPIRIHVPASITS